jgi:hypothetical protein
MTQSSPLDPKNVPLDGQATRDLKLALRGLNYDLNTELESFRKWRQQTQKPSNAQTPGLVTVPLEASRAYRRIQNTQTAPKLPKLPSLSPVTVVAGAMILLSLGSIVWLFTNRGEQGAPKTASIPASVQPSPSKSGSNLPSGTQSPKNSAKPEPAKVIASKPKIQAKPLTQGQTAKTKVTQPVSKPVAAVAALKKSTKADKPSAFSTFKGYGYYYVFVPVDGAKDLGRLKAMAPESYPRVIDGRTYMQMAAYDSDRRAQILAGQLRQRGYSVEVKK